VNGNAVADDEKKQKSEPSRFGTILGIGIIVAFIGIIAMRISAQTDKTTCAIRAVEPANGAIPTAQINGEPRNPQLAWACRPTESGAR
jgi:hypothetical protein